MTDFIHSQIDGSKEMPPYESFDSIYKVHRNNSVKKWLIAILAALILALFLPWTQNIKAKGTVTTLRPEQRPQEINNIIAGKVVKWYVKEGDVVKEGDTILQLGEVKVDYMDPELLQRTQDQLDAKSLSVEGYKNKAATAQTQAGALTQGRDLKLNQLDIKQKQQVLKVQSDSMDLAAVMNELTVSKRQIDAAKIMLDSGVISLVDFERRKVSYQNALAKKLGAENRLLQSKQEMLNIAIEKNGTIQDYTDKISKAEGDKFSSLSSVATTEGDIAKLKNIYASYDMRNQLYYVRAPQSGQIVQAKKAGIGEILKEGDLIVEIIPNHFDYAVEMYIDPVDQPLVNKGQKVRFVFDGFPAIIFTGWPEASYGTFAGVVTAVENNTSKDGKFRVLVQEDTADRPWPKQLRLGGAASCIALLKDVPVWYELWRNINGFPPDYYQPSKEAVVKK